MLDPAGHDGLGDAAVMKVLDHLIELPEFDPAHLVDLGFQLRRGDAMNADGRHGDRAASRRPRDEERELTLSGDQAEVVDFDFGGRSL